MRKSGVAALAVVSLCAALFAIYWSGLQSQFFFDDQANILIEEGVRLHAFSFDAIRGALASGSGGPSGRPIARLTFALNYLFAGFDPFAFKLTNLAIHAATAGLVFLLAMHLFSVPRFAKDVRQAITLSTVLTVVWLIHPIQLLPVLHVVQRMTSLSAFFLLAALLCHIRGRETGSFRRVLCFCAAWGIFWPLSFLSKEIGALFPLFVLAWELIVKRDSLGALDRFARCFALVMVGGVLLLVVYLLSPASEWLWAGYNLRSFSLAERLLTDGRVLWFYIELIFFPRLEEFGLFHDDFPTSTGIFVPWTTLPAIFGLLGLVWLGWRIGRCHALAAFGIAWFLIGHCMESTVLPLEMVHEHRNYLPLFGALLAMIACLQRMLEKPGPLKTAAIAVMAVMLTYFPLVTALRSHEFGDEVRRSQIEAQHHRQSARAQHEAGRVLTGLVAEGSTSSPAYAMAKAHFELAGQLDPDFKMSWLGLVHLNCRVAIPVQKTWVDELQHRLAETSFAPGDRTVLYSLKEMAIDGSVCLARHDVDRLFTAAIVNPRVSPYIRAMLHSWHADFLWLREHDLPAARVALGASLTLVPNSASNQLKWAQLLLLNEEVETVRPLLLKLRNERFSRTEEKTLDELLTATAMLGSQNR